MAPPPSTLLDVQGLDFGHPGQPLLFRQWSASVAPGLTWVVGGEGRGKTTLLQLLAGRLVPAAGRLRLDGVALQEDPRAYLAKAFLAGAHDPAHDNTPACELVAQLASQCPRFDYGALSGHVLGLGLEDHWPKPMYMLSTGSRHKVLQAAALACGAPLRLLDMPFAGLDAPSIRYLVRTLEEAAQHLGTAWVLADYEAHPTLAGATVIDLGA